jgi:hypothetical protein
MSEPADDFLEHYGIPGMKWGKRSSKSAKSGGGKKLTFDQAKSRKKKIAIAIGVGAVVAVGAAFAAHSISKNSKMPISNLINKPETKRGREAPKFTPPKSAPSNSSKPKIPSPYPMTPLIKTPVLDELLKKYNPSVSDLMNAI